MGKKKRRNPEIEQPTAPDGNKKPRKTEQLTQKKTEQRKHNQPKKIQSQEWKHHTSPDFVPVRNKFSSKK